MRGEKWDRAKGGGQRREREHEGERRGILRTIMGMSEKKDGYE